MKTTIAMLTLLAAGCYGGWVHVHPSYHDDDGVVWQVISCEDEDTCQRKMTETCRTSHKGGSGGFVHSDFQEITQDTARCVSGGNRYLSATTCRSGDEVVGVKVAFHCEVGDE